MTDIHIISDTQTLAQKCTQWQDKDYVTIDTEFLRTSTYWPNLCLIQMGHGGTGVLIDPLADIDLEPLFELLKSPRVVKVFHDARQDIEIFHHIANFCPSPIFDSQVSAQACGFGPSPSYESLVQQLVGQKLDKSVRVTDWSKRPLSERQQLYALGDVTYLCSVYEKLQQKLKTLNRLHWVEEEFAKLSQPSLYENPPDRAWQNIKFKASNERQQLMLEIIAAWREEEAQKQNRPRGWILRDETMRHLMAAAASQLPFGEVQGLPKAFLNSNGGKALIQQIAKAQETMPENSPSKKVKNGAPHKKGNKNDNKVSMLKLLLKIQCENHDVAPRLITNAQQIEAFAFDPKSPNPIKEGFRYEVFGQWAEALMNGEISLSLINDKTQIVKTTPSAPKQS